MATSKSSGASQYQIAWTTARCNRLLRPLILRLTLLRKHVHTHNVQQTSFDTTSLSSGKGTDGDEEQSAATWDETVADEVGKQEKHDVDWAPLAARKKLKRKYAVRGEARAVPSKPDALTKARAQPGEICISTPYLARTYPNAQDTPDGLESDTRNESLGTTSQSPSLHKSRGARSDPLKSKAHLQDLKRTVSPEEWTLFDNLYEAVGNLLKTTTTISPPTYNGPRPLLSTCLRQVPAYIELEEYWRKRDDEDDKTNISSEVYTYLESTLGSPQGWKPLKEIVRAHGMSLLKQVIIEGVLTTQMVNAMAALLCQHQAVSEADDLLDLFLTQEVLESPQSLETELTPKGAYTTVFLEPISKKPLCIPHIYYILTVFEQSVQR